MRKTNSLTRLILLIMAGINFISILAGSLILWFDRGFGAWLVLCLSIPAILVTLFGGILLYSQYRRTPSYQKKKDLLKQKLKVDGEIKAEKVLITQAQQARHAIRHEETFLTTQRQAAHQEAVERIQQRRSQIAGEEEREKQKALEQIQTAHIENGLKLITIKDANIPGIGPKFRERLAEHGMVDAYTLDPRRIAAIQGFGPAKVEALAAWRALAERNLRASMPEQIPNTLLTRINTSYDRAQQRLEEEEEKSHASLEADLAAYSRQAAEKHAQNDALETCSKELLESLERIEKKIHTQLEPYANVSFLNYLKGCVFAGKPESRLSNWGLAVGLTGLLTLGPLLQAGLGATSTASILLASLPTRTHTPTITPTPPPTLTMTPTPPATATFAPTATLTPTSTLAPADTSTPTIPPTPTITPTPTHTQPPTATLPSSSMECIPKDTLRQAGKVVRVIDGDTIEVRLGDKKVYRVRYIGIDTPEKGDQNFWETANKNSQLVDGKRVTLIKDVSETDQYDRLLRYVLAGDIFVNYEMVYSGFAQVSTYPPDVACSLEFDRALSIARESESGLWAPTPAPDPGQDRPGCDPAYPDVCISPPPPDLDCGEITYRRFRVLSPDPHRFDGDGNGIGCEK